MQSNWRSLLPGRELDELVCKIVGWSVTTEPIGNTATLWSPDLKIVNTWGSSEAWPNVVQIAWNNAPRYSRDLNDAWSLAKFELRCLPDGTHAARVLNYIDGHGPNYRAFEAACACVRAWLAYRDGERDSNVG
jgi:hypothetical protein